MEKQLRDFDDKALIRIFKLFSAAAALVLLYAFFFSGFQIVDEFEHLHASWLVSTGKVPYKDFFEHHNPLLWYLSAPLVSLFYDNAVIFYVMRGVSAGISVLSLFFIYKTVLLYASKSGAWLAVALTLGNIITVYNFSQYRPDNFMNCCFIIGIYYWFCYMKSRQLKSLVLSFLGFTFSALFLQKISLLLIAVECLILIMAFGKKMSFKDITLAAFPSLGAAAVFLLFLYQQGAFADYIELNLHFNRAMVAYFDRGSFWYGNLLFSFYGLALLAAILFYRQENIYFRALAWIYGAEFMMRHFILRRIRIIIRY